MFAFKYFFLDYIPNNYKFKKKVDRIDKHKIL